MDQTQQDRDDGQTTLPVTSNIPAATGVIGRSSVVRLLYTNNPFYALSAALVFWGLRISFPASTGAFQAGVLILSLASYVLLLAGTAYALIRFGRVWDDVRSLLLLVVLLLLALSITFDDALAATPWIGRLYGGCGWLFAAVLSEMLLRGLRIRLPALFRIPYHLLLAMFFLYPIAISPLLDHPHSAALQWALFGFSTIGGCLFLTLLPAVRRGPQYVADNGTPWRWPLFPWTLFAVLGFGVCARAYYVCQSLHFEGGSGSIFGLYFLVPFLLAVAVVLLEMAIVSGSRTAQRSMLALPVGLLMLAGAAHRQEQLYQHFLELFQSTLGATPLFMTLAAAAGWYFYAMLRKVPLAADALALALAAMSAIDLQTNDLGHLEVRHGWPLLMAAAVQLALAFRRFDSQRCLLGVVAAIGGLCVEFHETWFMANHGFIPFNLLLAGMLAIGVFFRGRFARKVQRAAAVLCLAGSWLVLWAEAKQAGDAPAILGYGYPLIVILVSFAYGRFVRNRWFSASGSLNLTAWLGVTGFQGYQFLRPLVVGLDHLALGALFFLIAALISLIKTGLVDRWLQQLQPRVGSAREQPDG